MAGKLRPVMQIQQTLQIISVAGNDYNSRSLVGELQTRVQDISHCDTCNLAPAGQSCRHMCCRRAAYSTLPLGHHQVPDAVRQGGILWLSSCHGTAAGCQAPSM